MFIAHHPFSTPIASSTRLLASGAKVNLTPRLVSVVQHSEKVLLVAVSDVEMLRPKLLQANNIEGMIKFFT